MSARLMSHIKEPGEVVTLYGLTHTCNDPACHVRGFVATLRTMSHPADDCFLLDCPRCIAATGRILDDLNSVIPPAVTEPGDDQ